MFPPNTKILVVDDMKTMRMVVKKALKELGFTDIHEADDGATAWPLLDAAVKAGQPFQMVLSDWNMPNMMGIDLLKKVRADAGMTHLPFIMVTAEKEKHQVMEAIKEGVSQYLTKPFTPDSMREKLELVHKKMAA